MFIAEISEISVLLDRECHTEVTRQLQRRLIPREIDVTVTHIRLLLDHVRL